jgi:hypothetical protein
MHMDKVSGPLISQDHLGVPDVISRPPAGDRSELLQCRCSQYIENQSYLMVIVSSREQRPTSREYLR